MYYPASYPQYKQVQEYTHRQKKNTHTTNHLTMQHAVTPYAAYFLKISRLTSVYVFTLHELKTVYLCTAVSTARQKKNNQNSVLIAVNLTFRPETPKILRKEDDRKANDTKTGRKTHYFAVISFKERHYGHGGQKKSGSGANSDVSIPATLQ